jgi:hypothetical protein
MRRRDDALLALQMQQTLRPAGQLATKLESMKTDTPKHARCSFEWPKLARFSSFSEKTMLWADFTRSMRSPAPLNTKSLSTVLLVSFVLNNQFLLYKTVGVHSK